MNDRLQRLGLATRAGAIVFGEALYTDLSRKKIALVILAEDASANTRKKVHDKCTTYQVPVVTLATKAALGHAIGKSDVAAIGITNVNIAKAFLNDKKEGVIDGETN